MIPWAAGGNEGWGKGHGSGGGGDLYQPYLDVCVCRKMKDMGPFLASSE